MTDQTSNTTAGSDSEGEPQGGIDLKTATARSRALAASLGAVVAIMMRSPEHRNAKLSEIEALVGPPLGLDQVAIIEARDPNSGLVAPVAAVLWAVVSADVDERLSKVEDPRPLLKTADWRSGPIPWIITAVGHKAAVAQLMEQVVASRFPDTAPKIRVRAKDGTPSVGLVRLGHPPEAPEDSASH